MDAPSDDDESLIERGRRNLVVNCEPSFSFSGFDERLNAFALGLLSRVVGVASPSNVAFRSFTRA